MLCSLFSCNIWQYLKLEQPLSHLLKFFQVFGEETHWKRLCINIGSFYTQSSLGSGSVDWNDMIGDPGDL